MNPKLASLAKLAPALLCACSPLWAQTVPTPAPPERGEPNVKRTVVEDGGSKIEELNVRGQVQHVVVTPKVGLTTPYEIVIAPAGRDPFDGTGGARTAVGKRVWNVLKF